MEKISILILVTVFLWCGEVIANTNNPFRSLSETQLMALVIYGEARGESKEGKVAVGSVIIERKKQSRESIKNIILNPHQFSCFSVDNQQYKKLKNIAAHWNKYKADPQLRECQLISSKLLQKTLLHKTIKSNSVTHFKTNQVNPSWAKQMRFVVQIGNHQFYSMKERKIKTGFRSILDLQKGGDA